MAGRFEELLRLIDLKAVFEQRFGELMRSVRDVAASAQLGVKWGKQAGDDVEFTFLGRSGRIRLGHAAFASDIVGEICVSGIGSDGMTHALCTAYIDADGNVRLGENGAASLSPADPDALKEIAAHLFTPLAALK